MTGIYRRKPDAHHDQREQCIPPAHLVTDAVIEHHQRISSMQRRHGRKDIAALGIKSCKDMYMKDSIPATQPGRITRRMRIEDKTILLYIPWRRGRKQIVDHKAYEIDEQKAQRKTEKSFLIVIEQECGK